MALQRLRKDDTVMVIAGKERGKTGKVLRVLADRDRVLIERVNMVKRHVKPRGVQQPGGIQEKEASIHLSNVLPCAGAATSRRASAAAGSPAVRCSASASAVGSRWPDHGAPPPRTLPQRDRARAHARP